MDEKKSGPVSDGFYRHQYRRILGSSKARFHNLSEPEVEDVVGDVMADLLERADLVEEVENFTAYVYRAIFNKAVDYLRKKKKSVSLDGEAVDKNHPALSYSMQYSFESAEIKRRIDAALERLEKNQREVWEATELGGHTFAELAKKWGLPIGTLLARKHRAVVELRKELADLKNY